MVNQNESIEATQTKEPHSSSKQLYRVSYLRFKLSPLFLNNKKNTNSPSQWKKKT